MTNTLQQVRELIEKKMGILKKELDIAGDQKWGQTFLVNESKIHAFQELLSELHSLPSEWIVVTDRLPENSNDILMKGTFGFTTTAIGRYHNGEGFVQPSQIGWYKCENVTHWMPLPPSP